MKPRPNAVCHEAAGSRSTGIIDAHSTSESRKMLPLNAPGSCDQSGPAQRNAEQQRDPDGDADEWKTVRQLGVVRVDDDVGDDRQYENEGNDKDARPIDGDAGRRIGDDRRVRLLLLRRWNAENQQGDAGGNDRLEYAQRRNAGDPHHRRRCVAHDADEPPAFDAATIAARNPMWTFAR